MECERHFRLFYLRIDILNAVFYCFSIRQCLLLGNTRVTMSDKSQDIHKNHVVLVDELDCVIGTMEKLEAHQKGKLHRAISVCLFDAQGRWLLQRRASEKYHSPNLIANTCCSHPYLYESPLAAAVRRLEEELRLSFSTEKLQGLGSFLYREDVGQGLVEHELDHLFIGMVHPHELEKPNPSEVSELLWMSESEIREKLKNSPSMWTRWFPHVFYEVSSRLSLS